MKAALLASLLPAVPTMASAQRVFDTHVQRCADHKPSAGLARARRTVYILGPTNRRFVRCCTIRARVISILLTQGG